MMQLKIIKIATKIKGKLNSSLKKLSDLLKLPMKDEIINKINEIAGAAAKNKIPI